MKQKMIVIVGPTSSGKSDLAVELARKFNGEVISADSRQVFQGLDIGTGKITKREMRGIKHYLLDVASPKKVFTAHDFAQKASGAIATVAEHGKIPIVAGGTGFYIDALLGHTSLPSVPVNEKLRARLEKKGFRKLYEMLEKKDPRRARAIDPLNKRRIIRALEIAAALGTVPPIVDTPCPQYEAIWIGIAPERNVLHEKIHDRLLARTKQGLVAEAHRLHAHGLSYKRMESLGLEYRWLARFLQKKISRQEMLEGLEYDIRHYTKRQMTYWRRNKKITWFDPKETAKISRLVKQFVNRR